MHDNYLLLSKLEQINKNIHKQYRDKLNKYQDSVSVWIYTIAGSLISENSFSDYLDFIDCFDNGIVKKDISKILERNNIVIIRRK